MRQKKGKKFKIKKTKSSTQISLVVKLLTNKDKSHVYIASSKVKILWSWTEGHIGRASSGLENQQRVDDYFARVYIFKDPSNTPSNMKAREASVQEILRIKFNQFRKK